MSAWNYNKDDIDRVKLPKKIVEKFSNELGKITDGKIVARVQEYNGAYVSEDRGAPIVSLLKGDPLKFDVQSIMGENATSDGERNKFVYEMYITSKNTPNYRYRVLIMYYGILMYPVGMTIQEDIANEIGLKSEGINIENEDELNMVIEKILGSDTIGRILRNLARLNVND